MSNKSGTSSQVISLPKGGGALQDIGEIFSPGLFTGTGNFTVPIALPSGRNGFQPEINLVYSTGTGNGPFGLGWGLSVPGISRKTSKGVPQYRDYAPNIEELKIQHLVLYFARTDTETDEVEVERLLFTQRDETKCVGGGATSADGVISTRRGNAGSWTPMIGRSPIGEWELALPNTEEMKNRFKNEEIEDMLFVITYRGQTPAWPV